MPHNITRRKRYKNVPGTVIECKSGRYLAFYEHRPDVIANGNSEVEAKKNLKKLFDTVVKHEKEEEEKKEDIDLPKDFKSKRFVEKLSLK